MARILDRSIFENFFFLLYCRRRICNSTNQNGMALLLIYKMAAKRSFRNCLLPELIRSLPDIEEHILPN